MMRLALTIASLASLFFQGQAQNLVETVMAVEDLSLLEEAVIQADLATTLSGDGPFTVFAPTNSSFEALPDPLLSKLLTDPWKAHLADVLLYHVAAGNVSSGDLSDGQVITMVNEENVTISIMGSTVMVNGAATVVMADVYASNGVAHVIDAVLTPSFLTTTIVDIALSAATTLAELVVMAELDGTLSADDGEYTVFAPTNEAFAALDNATLTLLKSPEGKETLTSILTYHVVAAVVPAGAIADGDSSVDSLESSPLSINKSDSGVTVNGVSVIMADVLAVNGIVHVIDTVLEIPAETAAPTTSGVASAAFAAGVATLVAPLALL